MLWIYRVLNVHPVCSIFLAVPKSHNIPALCKFFHDEMPLSGLEPVHGDPDFILLLHVWSSQVLPVIDLATPSISWKALSEVYHIK